MRCEVLPTHTPDLFQQAVRRAAGELKKGEVVALPTETVYGLAANALSADAVERIYRVKERPVSNPVIVHVSSFAMARECVAEWPSAAEALAFAFWPGPLTLVLPRAEVIPDVVTAGGSTVGVRVPGHPLMRAVIDACGFPLAAPSANRSNELSPTNAEHVRETLGDKLRLVVDGGQCQVGIESTVVDLTGERLQILRPGMIDEISLREAARAPVDSQASADTLVRSPGNLPRHYAPRATLLVINWEGEQELLARLPPEVDRTRTTVVCHSHIPSSAGWQSIHVIPLDAEAFARALYAELHRCDMEGAQWIVVEAVPETAAWEGIADRLKRGATPDATPGSEVATS